MVRWLRGMCNVVLPRRFCKVIGAAGMDENAGG